MKTNGVHSINHFTGLDLSILKKVENHLNLQEHFVKI